MKPEHACIFNALTDWQLMGLCIEREASGEPTEGRIAVGTVILERVDHRKWDGRTVKEVILWPWQFTWTMETVSKPYYEAAVLMASNWTDAYRGNQDLQDCSRIAIDMLQGVIKRDPDLSAVHCCQYLNPRVAAETRKHWLAAGMVSVKVIGRHEFFI